MGFLQDWLSGGGNTNKSPETAHWGNDKDAALGYMQDMTGRAEQWENKPAVQADFGQGNANATQEGNALASMGNSANRMQDVATGKVQTAADINAQNQLNQSVAAQMGMASGAKGGAGARAEAYRNAQATGANMQQRAIADNAMRRFQEQMAAEQAYANTQNQMAQGYGSMRGEADKNAQFQAAMQNAQREQALSAWGTFGGLGQNAMNSELNAQTHQYASDTQAGMDAAHRNQSAVGSEMVMGAALLGAMGVSSDIRAKADVKYAGVKPMPGHLSPEQEVYGKEDLDAEAFANLSPKAKQMYLSRTAPKDNLWERKLGFEPAEQAGDLPYQNGTFDPEGWRKYQSAQKDVDLLLAQHHEDQLRQEQAKGLEAGRAQADAANRSMQQKFEATHGGVVPRDGAPSTFGERHAQRSDDFLSKLAGGLRDAGQVLGGASPNGVKSDETIKKDVGDDSEGKSAASKAMDGAKAAGVSLGDSDSEASASKSGGSGGDLMQGATAVAGLMSDENAKTDMHAEGEKSFVEKVKDAGKQAVDNHVEALQIAARSPGAVMDHLKAQVGNVGRSHFYDDSVGDNVRAIRKEIQIPHDEAPFGRREKGVLNTVGDKGAPQVYTRSFFQHLFSDKNGKEQVERLGHNTIADAVRPLEEKDEKNRAGHEMTHGIPEVEEAYRKSMETGTIGKAFKRAEKGPMPYFVPEDKAEDLNSKRPANTLPYAAAKPHTLFGDIASLFSDKNAKDQKHTEGAGGSHDGKANAVSMFLDSLAPYEYKYKNPADAPSMRPDAKGDKYIGVMAQNVERSPTGHSIVGQDATGKKYLEIAPMMSAMAAGLGQVHERLRQIEDESQALSAKKGR